MTFQEALDSLTYGENCMIAEISKTRTVAALTPLPGGRYAPGQVTEKRVITIQLGGKYGRLFAQGQNVIIEMARSFIDDDKLTTDWEIRTFRSGYAIQDNINRKESGIDVERLDWEVQS